MTERYSPINKFDRSALSETLQAEAAVTRDVAHGDGARLSLGDGKTALEVYPGAGVARVSTMDARVEAYRIPGYSLNQRIGRVIFDHGPEDQRMRLLVNRDGMVSFHPLRQPPESSQTGETPLDDAQVTLLPSSDSEAATSPQEPSSTTGDTTEKAEAEEIQLQGRLGRDPWFGTDEEMSIGRFPLAVNADTGKTTWHRVVVFGETAEQLQDAHHRRQIRKGRLVDVTGRHVVSQEQTDDGRTRSNREFHATIVAPVKSSTSQSQRP